MGVPVVKGGPNLPPPGPPGSGIPEKEFRGRVFLLPGQVEICKQTICHQIFSRIPFLKSRRPPNSSRFCQVKIQIYI